MENIYLKKDTAANERIKNYTVYPTLRVIILRTLEVGGRQLKNVVLVSAVNQFQSL